MAQGLPGQPFGDIITAFLATSPPRAGLSDVTNPPTHHCNGTVDPRKELEQWLDSLTGAPCHQVEAMTAHRQALLLITAPTRTGHSAEQDSLAH